MTGIYDTYGGLALKNLIFHIIWQWADQPQVASALEPMVAQAAKVERRQCCRKGRCLCRHRRQCGIAVNLGANVGGNGSSGAQAA